VGHNMHEDMAENMLDNFMGTPDGALALQVYYAGLKAGRWGRFYRESIHQGRWAGGLPLEQIAAFAHFHSEVMSGCIAAVGIETDYESPGPDSDRAGNAARLTGLPWPFVAEVDPGQHQADNDGYLKWIEPIQAEASTGTPFTRAGGRIEPRQITRTIPPGRVPLEIGTTRASVSLLHVIREKGLARWPYGHDRISLFVRTGACAHWRLNI
jgi:hypothetical protein